MYQFEQNVFINRPQQEVFDYLTNPVNNPQWQSGGGTTEMTSEGPIGLGSTFRSTTKFLGRGIGSTLEFSSWDPPKVYTQKALSGPIPFELKTTLDSKENGTQLTISGQAEFSGFFKMAEGLVGKQLEKRMDTDLNALKLLLEEG